MKGILINPFDHTVKEVDILGNLEDCYLLMNCSTVDAISFDDDNTLWVDDEGLLRENMYFNIRGRNLAGNALLMGYDYNTGGNIDVQNITALSVEDEIEWLPRGHREQPYEFKVLEWMQKMKELRARVKPIQVEWLKSLLPDEQSKTITVDNVNELMPDLTHTF